MTPEPPRTAIVGGGSIGVAFALLFALRGGRVSLWDPFPAALDRARAELVSRLPLLRRHGLLEETDGTLLARVSFHDDLAEAVAGAALVQECAPERLELKQDLYRRIGEVADPQAVLGGASSAIGPSRYAAGLGDDVASRIIGAHPGNPPYLLPVIELIPGSTTSAATVDRAREIFTGAGMKVVLVRREVEGFLFNRLQGALLREAYCLVRDGVASVEDVDTVVRAGLGRRYAIMGPFETSDLNTRGGIVSHAEKMGAAYERMGAERGQRDPWTADLVETVERQRREVLPLDEWEARVAWRDEMLACLTRVLGAEPR